MSDLPATFDCRFRSWDLIQCLPILETDIPFPGGSAKDLRYARNRIPRWLHILISAGPSQEDSEPHDSGGGGRPESKAPFPSVFIVYQYGVGEKEADVEGKVDVGEESRFKVLILLLELISSKSGNSGLVAPVPQSHQIYGQVEQG